MKFKYFINTAILLLLFFNGVKGQNLNDMKLFQGISIILRKILSGKTKKTYQNLVYSFLEMTKMFTMNLKNCKVQNL